MNSQINDCETITDNSSSCQQEEKNFVKMNFMKENSNKNLKNQSETKSIKQSKKGKYKGSDDDDAKRAKNKQDNSYIQTSTPKENLESPEQSKEQKSEINYKIKNEEYKKYQKSEKTQKSKQKLQHEDESFGEEECSKTKSKKQYSHKSDKYKIEGNSQGKQSNSKKQRSISKSLSRSSSKSSSTQSSEDLSNYKKKSLNSKKAKSSDSDSDGKFKQMIKNKKQKNNCQNLEQLKSKKQCLSSSQKKQKYSRSSSKSSSEDDQSNFRKKNMTVNNPKSSDYSENSENDNKKQKNINHNDKRENLIKKSHKVSPSSSSLSSKSSKSSSRSSSQSSSDSYNSSNSRKNKRDVTSQKLSIQSEYSDFSEKNNQKYKNKSQNQKKQILNKKNPHKDSLSSSSESSQSSLPQSQIERQQKYNSIKQKDTSSQQSSESDNDKKQILNQDKEYQSIHKESSQSIKNDKISSQLKIENKMKQKEDQSLKSKKTNYDKQKLNKTMDNSLFNQKINSNKDLSNQDLQVIKPSLSNQQQSQYQISQQIEKNKFLNSKAVDEKIIQDFMESYDCGKDQKLLDFQNYDAKKESTYQQIKKIYEELYKIISQLPRQSLLKGEISYEIIIEIVNKEQNICDIYFQMYQKQNKLKSQINEMNYKYEQEIKQYFRLNVEIKNNDLKSLIDYILGVIKNLNEFKSNNVQNLRKQVDDLQIRNSLKDIQAQIKENYQLSKEDMKRNEEIEQQYILSLSSQKKELLLFQNELNSLNIQKYNQEKQLKWLNQNLSDIKEQLQQVNQKKEILFILKSETNQNDICDQIKQLKERKKNYEKNKYELDVKLDEEEEEGRKNFCKISQDYKKKMLDSKSISKQFFRIFIIDKSYSMSSQNAYQKVIDGMVKLVTDLQTGNNRFQNDSILVMHFDQKAFKSFHKHKVKDIDIDSFKKNINIQPSRETNFFNPIYMLQEELNECYIDEIPVVTFLTDGQQTGNENNYELILKNIQQQYQDLIFFVLGYGSNINEQKLRSLCNIANNTQNCRKDFGSGYEQDLIYLLKKPNELYQIYNTISRETSKVFEVYQEKETLLQKQYKEFMDYQNNQRIYKKKQLDEKLKLIQENIDLLSYSLEQIQNDNTLQNDLNEYEAQRKELHNQEKIIMRDISEFENKIKILTEKIELKQNQPIDIVNSQNYSDKEKQFQLMKKNENNRIENDYENLSILGFSQPTQILNLLQQIKKIQNFQQILYNGIEEYDNFIVSLLNHCNNLIDTINLSLKGITYLKDNDTIQVILRRFFMKEYGLKSNEIDYFKMRESLAIDHDENLKNYFNCSDCKNREQYKDIFREIDDKDITSKKDIKKIIKKIMNKLHPQNPHHKLKQLKSTIKQQNHDYQNKRNELVKEQEDTYFKIKCLQQDKEELHEKGKKQQKNCDQSKLKSIIKQINKNEEKINKNVEKINQIQLNLYKINKLDNKLKKSAKVKEEKFQQEIENFYKVNKEIIKFIEMCVKSLEIAFETVKNKLYYGFSTQPFYRVLRSIESFKQLTYQKQYHTHQNQLQINS